MLYICSSVLKGVIHIIPYVNKGKQHLSKLAEAFADQEKADDWFA